MQLLLVRNLAIFWSFSVICETDLLSDIQTNSYSSIMAWLPSWLQTAQAPKADAHDNIIASQRSDLQYSSTAPSTSTLSSVAAEVQEKIVDSPSISSQYDMNEVQENFFRHGPELAIPMTGATLGFVAGFYTAATRSGLVFMAENAHRRPNTVQGWYFYNKTKVSWQGNEEYSSN